jgi:hypothetical protein
MKVGLWQSKFRIQNSELIENFELRVKNEELQFQIELKIGYREIKN